MSNRGFLLVSVLVLYACEQPAGGPATLESRPEPVVVYASYTDENYLPSLFAQFTRDTGIPVTLRHRPESQLVSEVIENRGSPPADILLTRSVHGVWQAADEGALLPLQSEKIPGIVPDWLRDPDGYWTATGFATIDVVCSANSRVDCNVVGTFEDLGKPELRSRLCLSSSSLAVNRTLIANLVADHGVRPAEIILRGWIANLALPPFGTEEALLQAIEAGNCGIGVVSALAFHRFDRPTVAARSPQPGYVDVEAAGIGRHARSPDAARRLIEWFVTNEVQVALPQASGLKPANAAAPADSFRNAGIAGAYEVDAVKLAERASWR